MHITVILSIAKRRICGVNASDNGMHIMPIAVAIVTIQPISLLFSIWTPACMITPFFHAGD